MKIAQRFNARDRAIPTGQSPAQGRKKGSDWSPARINAFFRPYGDLHFPVIETQR
jgi:hypothetical protein